METAALLNKVNDFARENNCRYTVVVFEKGHEEDLSARLFRMFSENGAQIIKVPTNGKEHAPKLNAAKDVMQSGKVKKTATKPRKSVSARKEKESKMLPQRKQIPQNAKPRHGSRTPSVFSMSCSPGSPIFKPQNNVGTSA